jgi:hypothetical protein
LIPPNAVIEVVAPAHIVRLVALNVNVGNGLTTTVNVDEELHQFSVTINV